MRRFGRTASGVVMSRFAAITGRTMRTGAALLLLVFCVPACAARAGVPASVGEAFRAGNDRYQAGDFEGAATSYAEALSHGYDAAALHYNLANAELKRGRVGRAIFEYRRALRLDPRNGDARANLEYARSLAVDVPPPAADPALLKLFLAAENAFPLPAALRLAAVGYWLTAAMLIAAWFLPSRRRLARGGAAVGLVVLLAGVLFMSFAALRERAGHEGVILDREAVVRTGPDAASTVLFTLHEGAEVEVQRRTERWIEVRISDELRGWVDAGSLGIL